MHCYLRVWMYCRRNLKWIIILSYILLISYIQLFEIIMNSTLKELSQWEEKTSKRKFKDDQEKNSPVLLREKGNEYFRTGDFSSALKFYTESLLQGESIEALGNRALVYLKTQEFQKAKNDCDRLLQIDSLNVKGLVRRATAKSSLGDHHGALEDFKLAESREPFNKLIRREREYFCGL